MPRVKRGTNKVKRRRAILKQTKGFRWGRKNKERLAKTALLHALTNAFKGRKQKKRTMRRLWQVKINAAVREKGIKYNEFIAMLKRQKVQIDRKILAELAEKHQEAFGKIVEEAKK